MQTVNRNSTTFLNTQTFNAAGVLQNASSIGANLTVETFLFSGFGSNDPRRKKNPTNGEFTKRFTRDLVGNEEKRESYYTMFDGWRYVSQGGFSGRYPNHFSAYGVTTDSNVYNNCLSKLYDQIRQSEANLAVSLGEYKETKKMLEQAVKSMQSVVVSARRLKRRLLHEPSKVVAEAWLAYKYGWLPAYNDVYALLNFTTRAFAEIEFKARAKRSYEVNTSPVISNGCHWRINGSRTYRVSVSVVCKVTDTTAFDLNRITSLNPLSIAWELVPFSFVFDWGLDVGGYLELQEAALGRGLTFVRGYTTETYMHYLEERQWNDFHVDYSGSFPRIDTYYRATAWDDLRWKRRTVLTGFPRPRFPTLDLKLGWQRLTSLFSLLRTILLK